MSLIIHSKSILAMMQYFRLFEYYCYILEEYQTGLKILSISNCTCTHAHAHAHRHLYYMCIYELMETNDVIVNALKLSSLYMLASISKRIAEQNY